MDTEVRIVGHGSIHAMGIWLSSVEYSMISGASGDLEAKLYVTNGERDLTPSSIFAEEMIIELEDGRRGTITTLAGSATNGVYRVRITGGLSTPPAQSAAKHSGLH